MTDETLRTLARQTDITEAMFRFRSAPVIGSLANQVVEAREELYAAIESALRHAIEQTQEECAPWMQHQKGCKAFVMFDNTGEGDWPNDCRIEENKCTCGLAAIQQRRSTP